MTEDDHFIVEAAYQDGFVPNDDADGAFATDVQIVAFGRRMLEAGWRGEGRKAPGTLSPLARIAELERQNEDLQAANNRYLERARAAEAEIVGVNRALTAAAQGHGRAVRLVDDFGRKLDQRLHAAIKFAILGDGKQVRDLLYAAHDDVHQLCATVVEARV